MQRDVAARAQDRLAQPLQAEHEQERTDDEAERVERDERQGRSESRDDRREGDHRDADARQRRAPVPRDAYREHDRQRLHHLDGAREERRQNEKNGRHA